MSHRNHFLIDVTREACVVADSGAPFFYALLGAATLDRLRHAAYRVVLDGESYHIPRPMPESNKSALAKGGKNKDS